MEIIKRIRPSLKIRVILKKKWGLKDKKSNKIANKLKIKKMMIKISSLIFLGLKLKKVYGNGLNSIMDLLMII